MIATQTCKSFEESICDYVENALPATARAALEKHLQTCKACRESVDHFVGVENLLQGTLGARSLSADFCDPDSIKVQAFAVRTPKAAPVETFLETEPAPQSFTASIAERLGAAPWFGVSVLLHGLVIALAGLISMAVSLPPPEDAVIMVTELAARPKVEIEQETKKERIDSPLQSKHETPPTDPTSKEFSDVVVPPDILAKAELGDHFETINPDRPDTQSAFGNPDAKMFHSVSGSDDEAGGGGDGGSVLSDAMIGVGAGRSSPGTGGGWGGGNGSGIGVGDGSGRGSFGNRNGGGRRLMVKRHGGSQKSEEAVDRALEWLARNQEADGSWSNQKHGDAKHVGVDGDAGMTGYALLAFLGAGHTEKTGKYKEHVKKGLAWLISKQADVKGKEDTQLWGRNYSNGIACMALGEAAGMSRIKETLAAAQRAINGVDYAQRQTEGTSDREAWDYSPRGSTNDSSVMAWNILALKSCKVAALKVNHSAFEGCLNWINAGQDLEGFKPGDAANYDWEGGRMSYRGTVANPNKGKGSYAVMAAAALCRLMIGGAKGDDPGVLGPCNLIKNKQIPKAYPFNLYFGYYATLLMFQKGGDHWKAWNEAMKKALIDGQVKGGNDDGSWDYDNGAGGRTACVSRVMSTALACLCLEVYYRYAKLAPDQ